MNRRRFLTNTVATAGLLPASLRAGAGLSQPAASQRNLSTEPKTTDSALTAMPEGWINISPGPHLEGWSEYPWFSEPPIETTQWHMDKESGILLCDGKGPHSRFLCNREFQDFIFHVEWRFAPEQRFYNSGVFVRMKLDKPNKLVMYQAEVGQTPDRFGFFNGGMLNHGTLTPLRARILVDGEWKPINPHIPRNWRSHITCIAPPTDDPDFWDASSPYDLDSSARINPPGEWNTYEITCRGKELSIWANGTVTCTAANCDTSEGRVGLEAERFRIEFRHLLLKPL